MKLIKGYSILKNSGFYLLFNHKNTGFPIFTGLMTKCKNKKDAIVLFNNHIPIIQDSILDQHIFIKSNI